MALPADFDKFIGNTPMVEGLRAAIADGRLPHSLILAGPAGVGKYTLALLLTLALLCERQPREDAADGRPLASFCGSCRHCDRLLEAADLKTRVAEAIAAREELRETDKKETRVLVQTHPDVLILPPDPPQLLIKLGQVRTAIQRAQYVPTEARARVLLFTAAAFMKEAANALLKLLEEPPPDVYLFLLAENTSDLLPTLRSRCALFRLHPLPMPEMETFLAAERPDLAPRQRTLIARLSEGAPGRATALDLESFQAARADALLVLSQWDNTGDHAPLFRMTEGYRAGAEGQAKTEALLAATARLLEDILLLRAGVGQELRNIDIEPKLRQIAESLDLPLIEAALRSVDQVRAGLRRNVLRSLSLDAMAVGLGSR